MIGALHLAAAASIIRGVKLMEAENRAREEVDRLLAARRAALEAERESDLAAAYTGQPIPTMVRAVHAQDAIDAAREKRRRKNARRLGIKLREIAGELESLAPVEIPQHLRDRYGMRIVNGEVVVPAMVGRALVEASEAQGVVWREKGKGERS